MDTPSENLLTISISVALGGGHGSHEHRRIALQGIGGPIRTHCGSSDLEEKKTVFMTENYSLFTEATMVHQDAYQVSCGKTNK